MDETPLIDVRAPIEFEKGAFQTSTNLPIMNNEERCLVGTRYKQEGNEAATKLGYKLVSGDVKEARVRAWREYLAIHPNAIVNCFRGGSRSQITQQWIREEIGEDIPRVQGGYKAFRNYLIQALEPENISMKPVILGGYTGGGKTILLNKLNNTIDLEKLGNHRGSSFGKHVTPQPTQINFENNLAFQLIQKQEKGYRHMILEDEGNHVGSCGVPKSFYEFVNCGDLVVLESTMEERVAVTLEEYVLVAQEEYICNAQDEKQGMEDWLEYITSSVKRVRRRMGDVRTQEMLQLIEQANAYHWATGSVDKHRIWIERFLTDYYDPMYEYQLKNTTKNIVFRGNKKEVLQYLQALK